LAVAVAVVPSLVQAQNYSQDFSATFPTPVQPGKVTVIMANEFDETIIPYVDYEIRGLFDDGGRHQFAARTGGADNDVLYEIDPLPETRGNGAYEQTPEFVIGRPVGSDALGLGDGQPVGSDALGLGDGQPVGSDAIGLCDGRPVGSDQQPKAAKRRP
jgi:hypothetical protein